MLSGQKPPVSLILPVKNEGSHIRNTIRSALSVKTDIPFEIVVVDDASSDGCCDFLDPYIGSAPIKLIRLQDTGLAKTKNIGAENASGQYFIFCDAHLFFEDYWIEGLLQPLADGTAHSVTPGIADTSSPLTRGYGQTLDEHLKVVWHLRGTSLFPAAVMPGGCFALPRDVFFDIGGFDKEFQRWGYEDVEISINMWLRGYSCFAQPKVSILHVFRKSTPYPVSFENVYFNMLRMAYSHFNEARIEKCRRLIPAQSLREIEASVAESGVMRQRAHYLSRRKYDDDWFMKKFSIPF